MKSVPTAMDLTAWWNRLDSGWQAVVFGAVVVAVVWAGVRIPW